MPDAKTSITLSILGMSCSACQHHVEAALVATPGVLSAHVDLISHSAHIEYSPSVAKPQQLIAAVHNSGYEAALPSEHSEKMELPAANNLATSVTLVAGFLLMFLSMPLDAGSTLKMGPADHLLMRVLPALYQIPRGPLRWTLLIVTAAIALWAGAPIYRAALRATLHLSTNMNTLVALGTSIALGYSAYATIFPAPNHAVYFDAVLLILGFLLFGKTLEASAKRRALAALSNLSRTQPTSVRRITLSPDKRDHNAPPTKTEEKIQLVDIKLGDLFLTLPGERFAVDATLIEGRTTVDESLLTGESTPLERAVGSRLLAGSLNYDGSVLCRAESIGATSYLARISQFVQSAQSSRTPLEGLADRISRIFVPVVLALALLTFATWFVLTSNLSLAISSAVAVLVIACPCAMGLAVPAALTVAVGRAAQLGILFKGGEALERLTSIDTLLLDKTGTLTLGLPTLSHVYNLSANSFESSTENLSKLSDDKILSIAAAAETQSNHPLAHAIIAAAKERSLNLPALSNLKSLPGRGLTAEFVDDDSNRTKRKIILGNHELLADSGITQTDSLPTSTPGTTRLYLAITNDSSQHTYQLIGAFDARDQLRPGVPAAMRSLTSLGLDLRILTGDSSLAAQPIAAEAGITHVEASLDPLAKLARIRALQSEGHRVSMVGDGINDSAALSQSNCGIALGSGTDLAQEAGDVILLRSAPALLPQSIALARATLRIMKQNLVWAVVYNLIGIPLAAGLLYPTFHILLSPWLASAAMAFSSVSVLANSLRLRSWRI